VFGLQTTQKCDEHKCRFSLGTDVRHLCDHALRLSNVLTTVQTQNGLALTALGVQDPAKIGTLTMVATLGVPLGTFVFRALAKLPTGPCCAWNFLLIGLGSREWESRLRWRSSAAAAVNQIGCGMILPTLLTWGHTRTPRSRSRPRHWRVAVHLLYRPVPERRRGHLFSARTRWPASRTVRSRYRLICLQQCSPSQPRYTTRSAHAAPAR